MDYTRSKVYATIDLLGKSVSAIALVILGVAGFLLQVNTEKAREAAETREQQERRYLPMLRSLSMLEIKLDDIMERLPNADTTEADRLGADLRFVASSVFVPDGDPLVSIRSIDRPLGRGAVRVQLPLRSTALLFAELLRVRSNLIQVFGEGDWSIDLVGQRLVHSSGGHQEVMPDSFPAWRAWMGSGSLSSEILIGRPLALNIRDLMDATSSTIGDVLGKHPGLGDRYVLMRQELDKNRLTVGRSTLSNTAH